MKRYGSFQRQFRKKAFGAGEPIVLSGPFAGMRYIDEIVWGPITPKWLGTYEFELHEIIYKIIAGAKLEAIIDIGAAEGYYAVGFAKSLSSSTVYTYDLDFRARRQQRRLAELNCVKNIIIDSSCDSDALCKRIKAHSSLVICDIEGFEVELLDPLATPALKCADILVEVHPGAGMSARCVGDLLRTRFCKTHQIDTIESRRRDPESMSHLFRRELKIEELLMAMDERRAQVQTWLWMRHCQ
jgi:hypothetical protein